VIREDQPHTERRLFWEEIVTFNRAAEHREIRHFPFRDGLGIGKHDGVWHGKQDSIVVPLIEVCQFHGGPV